MATKTTTTKPLSEQSLEELQAKKKVFQGLLMVMALLGLLYVAYYLYLMGTGSFEANRHLLGVVPLLGLALACLPSWMLLSQVSKEMAGRRETESI
ncbi:MAG: hypothetical protein AAF804_19160 [Bacteroidota bacterium]